MHDALVENFLNKHNAQYFALRDLPFCFVFCLFLYFLPFFVCQLGRSALVKVSGLVIDICASIITCLSKDQWYGKNMVYFATSEIKSWKDSFRKKR